MVGTARTDCTILVNDGECDPDRRGGPTEAERREHNRRVYYASRKQERPPDSIPRLSNRQKREIRNYLDSLAGMGFKFLPLVGKESHPGWCKATNLTEHPKMLFSQVKRFGSRSTGVGLWLGGEHKPGRYLFALDIDPRDGGVKSLRRLITAQGVRGLHRTATNITGGSRPGRHYFLTAPFRVGNGKLAGYPGIDIKGDGGYVVGPYSIHPDSGNEYAVKRHPRDGISEAPPGLLALLPRVGGRTGHRPTAIRKAHMKDSATVLTRRYPVAGIGCRNDAMTRGVGSMIGKGFDDESTQGALMDWYDHHAALGVVGTGREEHRREVADSIRRTRANPRFVKATGGDAHRQGRASIQLSNELRNAVKSIEDATTGRENTNGRGVPPIRFLLTDVEFAYVESLLCFCLYLSDTGELAESGCFRITSEQIGETMADRFPGLPKQDKKQLSRLRAKFVDRIGSPAQKVALLRELEEGKPGKPSEYFPEAILSLLAIHQRSGANPPSDT